MVFGEFRHNKKKVLGKINLFSVGLLYFGLAKKLDPVGSTVRYEMMKLCTGSV